MVVVIIMTWSAPAKLELPENCLVWREIVAGDTCWSVARMCQLSLASLYDHNKHLDGGIGCHRLKIGSFLCCFFADVVDPEEESTLSSLPDETDQEYTE